MKKRFFKGNFFLKILSAKFFALICVLMLSVGNAWGTDYYWKGTAVPVGPGKVSVQGWKGGSSSAPALSAITEEQWKTEAYEGTFTAADLGSLSSRYGRIGYYAKPDDGKYFWGWYTDSDCTENSYYSDSNPYINGKKASGTSTNSASPTNFGTYYAKFADNPIYKYSVSIQATTTAYDKVDNKRRGGVFTGNTIGNEGETTDAYDRPVPNYAYGKYGNVGQGAARGSHTPSAISSRSIETSATARLYTTAIPRHGNKFTGWTITDESGQTIVADGYSKDYWRCAFDITASSASPTKTGTVSASFAASTTAYTITVNKDAGLGAVAVQQACFYEYAGTSNGFYELRASLGTMGINDESTSYTNDTLFAGDRIVLTATPEGDNAFFGWYKVEGSRRTFITDQRILYEYISGDATYYALFQRPKVFAVGNVNCDTWEQAVATAENGSDKLILLKSNYTLPAGNYTLPAGVTLYIPFDLEHTEPWHTLRRIDTDEIPTGAYRTLTLANGAHLEVYGTIEVGGTQTYGTPDSRGDAGTGRPGAPTYGQMMMNSGSSITLNDGAIFKGYGYVLGQGEIDARRGSVVHEQFQIADYLGGQATLAATNTNKRTLPISQYYIQNIEVPVKYHPGSRLAGYSTLYAKDVEMFGHLASSEFFIDNVGIMGVYYGKNDPRNEPAMFLMDDADDSEDTWVRKYYDVEHDVQVYEVNNAAKLGSLVLTILGSFNVDSREFILPLPNNFKLHLLSGQLHVTQDTELLPGTEIEVDKKSTLVVDEDATLYLYDANDWGNFVLGKNGDAEAFVYATTVKWRPGGKPNVRTLTAEGLGSAKLKVHGTVEVKGYLKTTDGGAAITSSIEDAGSVVFATASQAESANDKLWQIDNITPHYVSIHCVPALLTNEAGSTFGTHSRTKSTAAGESFNFIDFNEDGIGEWVRLTADYDSERKCYPYVYDQGGVYYIKPQSYVPISSGAPLPEADNTIRDHYAGTDRIFIMTDDCQWWEVEETATPGVFHCINPENDTYYVYDASDAVDAWVEKKFKVSWVNWDGTPVNYQPKTGDPINYYMVTYGTVPTWLSENPTHADDASHSYSFKGWMPTPAAVTADVTYTAQYEERDRMYAIRFYDKEENGGSLIELVYCKLGQTPACSNHDLAEDEEWSPALGTVAGDQDYTLVTRNTVGPFDIKFVNWNGTQIGATQSVAKDVTPTPPANPTKADDDLHSYTFAGWSPAVGPATGHTTYTATYTTGPRSYTIRFFDDQAQQIGDAQSVEYGAMPTLPDPLPTKTNPADHKDYTLVWSPLVGTVVGNQDYTATFTEQARQYTVTWKNYDGSTITTDYVDYGATPAYSGLTPTKETAEKIFTFTGWSPAIASVAGNQEYTAQFDEGHLKTVTVAVDGTSDISGHVETLILNASEESSGQLTGNITATNAYFDFAINATTALATGATRQWHSFGVPWQVNLDTDPIQEVGGANRTFVLGRDYDIIYYDGAKRASSGAGYWCWEYLEYHSHILQPGQGYMIAFIPSLGNIGKIRFVKKNMAPVIFNGTMTVDAHNSGVTTNSGWNAIANPKAYKATLDAGATTGYVYNPATNDYTPYNIENKDYIVGKAVFIQAGASQSVVINNATGNSFVAAAPARRTNATDKKYMSLNDYYQIAIASERVAGGHVYVLPEEEKENKYVIGHDLAQFGMSTAVPQVWVNRYDTKLALNTTALVGETAEFPMGVYAPAAGEYTISLNAQPSEDYTVYLTRDGQVIWNLSDGAFVTTLTSGIQSNYGVRLVRKAPQVATGLDEAVVDAKNETRKVLIDNQVFIIREGHVYTVDGQIVK